MENEKFRKFSVEFTNKARPRSVRIKRIQEQHQVDLVDMTGMKVNYKWQTFKYILSLLDIFSRFHWLVPLERKYSKIVKKSCTKCTLYMGILKGFRVAMEAKSKDM